MAAAKRLRLAQQYFFVSCSLQDILHLLELRGEPLSQLPESFAVNGGRLDAFHWDPRLPPAEAARRCRRPAGFVLHPAEGLAAEVIA